MAIEDATPKMQRATARTAGVFYAVIIIAALFAEIGVRATLIDFSDALATATRLLQSEALYRAGLAADVLTVVCDIAVAVLLSSLLRSGGVRLAALTEIFRIVAAAITASASVLAFAPLILLKSSSTLSSMPPAELQDLSLAALALRQSAYVTSLLLFGIHCVLLGVLILRSQRIPGLIGWGMIVAGGCYLVNSLASLLVPAQAGFLFPYILMPCLLAEVVLTLWLIVIGARATSVQL